MKYIIVDDGGIEMPIVFPVFWNHSKVAMGIRGIPLSAGFIKRDNTGRLYVSGGSVSLNLKSRPEDLDLILQHLSFEI